MKKLHYIDWVRTQPCAECGKRPPSEAHHRTGHGMALKNADDMTMPLCHGCHMALHSMAPNSRFGGLNKTKLRAQQDAWIAKYQALYAIYAGHP